MMGILPTGAIPTEPQQRLSSVLESTYTTTTKLLQDEQAKQAWLKQVSERWSKVAEWLKEILYNSQTQPKWLSANYAMSS